MSDNYRNILGDNTANNQYNSSLVAPNPDGSIIERLETIQQAVGGVDSASNPVGANNADNGFASNLVTANPDGSGLERLEAIKDQIDAVYNFIDPEIAVIQTELSGSAGIALFPAGAAAADGVSIAEVLRYIQENIIRGSGTALPDAQSLYDILAGTNGIANWPVAAAPANGVSLAEGLRYIVETLIGNLTNTGGAATLGGIIGDIANISIAARLNSATKKTTIADGTTIPNNIQAAAGLLATATAGDILIEEIIWQRGSTSFAGPTNYEFSTDNINGLTSAANPVIIAPLAKFTAQNTGIASIDGAAKQIPFVLESTKKLFIHGDIAATAAGGATDFYIKYKRMSAGAYLA